MPGLFLQGAGSIKRPMLEMLEPPEHIRELEFEAAQIPMVRKKSRKKTCLLGAFFKKLLVVTMVDTYIYIYTDNIL